MTGRLLTRRELLGLFGRGAGVLAVAGSAGLTWRAVDGGVFAAGTGPAYDAWSLPTESSGSLDLIRAAVLAANAHNTQPWLYRVLPNQIDLFADLTRTIGAMDPLLRELHISLGCAVENLVVAAQPAGLKPTVELLPDPTDTRHVASVALAPAAAVPSPLHAAIASRHTDRAGYQPGRPVPAGVLGRYRDMAGAEDVTLVWFESADQRRSFGELTVRATEAIIADPDQSSDDYHWYRTNWHEIERLRDGVTIDASGQPRLIRTVAKLLPTTQKQNADGWLRGTRDSQVPTAAAFGALVVPDGHDDAARLRVGRVWQRLHLMATVDGLSMQPLCQIPERVDREESSGHPGEFTRAMAELLPTHGHAIMTFRIGYPTVHAPASPRRRLNDVLIGQTR